MPDAEIVVVSDQDQDPQGDKDMAKEAGQVDATIDKVLDQSFAKTHESWLSEAERENAGAGFLAEVTRLTFGAAASMQVQLAGGVLAQRAAQAQPQSPGGAGQKGVPGQVSG